MSSNRELPQPSQVPKHIAIAKKPLSKQLSRGGGRFTCGHCSRQFKRRFSLKRHVAMHLRKKKEKFGDIDPRFQHLERELHLRMRATKVSAPPAPFFKVRGGAASAASTYAKDAIESLRPITRRGTTKNTASGGNLKSPSLSPRVIPKTFDAFLGSMSVLSR